MAKVILICGKICSGKTWYTRRLKETEKAVVLSTDELTYDLICNQQGEEYNEFARRANLYLRKKAAEIAAAGCSVILDWGFWTREDRQNITVFFHQQGLSVEWHYIDVSEARWEKNIRERNRRIEAGQGGSDFFVDEGLRQKVLSLFQAPKPEEIDVWYRAEE